jgi:hypothetical protein
MSKPVCAAAKPQLCCAKTLQAVLAEVQRLLVVRANQQ